MHTALKVQSMSSGRASVYVYNYGRVFLAFCADCQDFVAASAKLGGIAVAARAHRCEARMLRKPPLKIDPAEHWLRATGTIA